MVVEDTAKLKPTMFVSENRMTSAHVLPHPCVVILYCKHWNNVIMVSELDAQPVLSRMDIDAITLFAACPTATILLSVEMELDIILKAVMSDLQEVLVAQTVKLMLDIHVLRMLLTYLLVL